MQGKEERRLSAAGYGCTVQDTGVNKTPNEKEGIRTTTRGDHCILQEVKIVLSDKHRVFISSVVLRSQASNSIWMHFLFLDPPTHTFILKLIYVSKAPNDRFAFKSVQNLWLKCACESTRICHGSDKR